MANRIMLNETSYHGAGAVKEIATQRGYDAVIDRASAQSMIFASPRIDISNEVLAKLGYSN